MSVLDKDTLLDSEDRAILFGNVRPVRECSERLLGDLETCWQDNILLNGICEVMYMHCIEHFNVYVRYCENQVHLGAALKRCRSVTQNILHRMSINTFCYLGKVKLLSLKHSANWN